jgi:nucleotide-binding universal stress UspA family protein
MSDTDRVKHVLIATDGSVGSQEAVVEGVRLAKLLDAEVIFIAVARPPLPVLGDPYYQRALTENLSEMRAALARAIPVAEERRVPYETELLEGSAAGRIVELARSRGVELIVVGSRGLGAVTGTLLGSVSAAVVHEADRPVLVVRPRDRARRHELEGVAV